MPECKKCGCVHLKEEAEFSLRRDWYQEEELKKCMWHLGLNFIFFFQLLRQHHIFQIIHNYITIWVHRTVQIYSAFPNKMQKSFNQTRDDSPLVEARDPQFFRLPLVTRQLTDRGSPAPTVTIGAVQGWLMQCPPHTCPASSKYPTFRTGPHTPTFTGRCFTQEYPAHFKNASHQIALLERRETWQP